MIANIPIEKFYPKINQDHILYGRSMRKVVHFDRGGKNPNNVVNAYDYNYYHFTVDDNLGLTEMQRNEYKKNSKKVRLYICKRQWVFAKRLKRQFIKNSVIKTY